MPDNYAPKNKYLWDGWFIEENGLVHAFYLQASREYKAKSLRDDNSTIGHAVSSDLLTWQELPTALDAGGEGEWDDLSLWAGSVIKHKQVYYMFYTGRSTSTRLSGMQRIGLATSDNLTNWTKYENNPILSADGQVYDTASGLDRLGRIGAWRDPFVLWDDSSEKFIMLIAARDKSKGPEYNGCIGLAVSDDLLDWEVKSPLLSPGLYDEMEVPHMTIANGKHYLFFSTMKNNYEPNHAKANGSSGGLHCYLADSLFGDYRPANGTGLVFDDKKVYDLKLVKEITPNQYRALGWLNKHREGDFIGRFSRPYAVLLEGERITVDES